MRNQKKKLAQNAPDSRARRSAIKKIAVGVGALAGYSVLPKKWIPPVVGQIVLPAHAQTSGSPISDEITMIVLSGDQSSTTVSVQVSGLTVPPTANLAVGIAVQAEIDPTVASMLNSKMNNTIVVVEEITCEEITHDVTTEADGTFSSDFNIHCGPGIISVEAAVGLSGSSSTAGGSLDIPKSGDTTTTPAPTTTSDTGTTTTTSAPGTTTTTTTTTFNPGTTTTTARPTTTPQPTTTLKPTTTPTPTTTSAYEKCMQDCLDGGHDYNFCADACDDQPH